MFRRNNYVFMTKFVCWEHRPVDLVQTYRESSNIIVTGGRPDIRVHQTPTRIITVSAEGKKCRGLATRHLEVGPFFKIYSE